MRPFDKILYFLEKIIEPRPGYYEFIPDEKKEKKTRYNWKGVPPEKWQGLAIINNRLFNANNAGPFVFTRDWWKDYNHLSLNQQKLVDSKFEELLNNPTRQVTVEIKHAKGLGNTVMVWQIEHDIYLLFIIAGPERKVIWFDLLDDHDVYNKYLNTGRKT